MAVAQASVASPVLSVPFQGINPEFTAVSGRSTARAGFLKKCATMRNPLPEPHRCTESQTPAGRRVARLHRGVDRWELSHVWRKTRVRNTLLLTLTCKPGQEDALWGEWRRVWNAVEKRLGKQRYFAWLELTRAGRPHYHVLWLNAPWLENEAPAVWIERLWGHGHVDQVFQDGRGSLASAVRYVRGYVKKTGAKAYQQEYTAAAAGLRTFNSDRKQVSVDVLDRHLDRWEATYADGQVVLTARLEHLRNDCCAPEPGQLEAAARKARYRRARQLGKLWTNSGESREFRHHHIKESGRADKPRELAQLQELEQIGGYVEWRQTVEDLPW